MQVELRISSISTAEILQKYVERRLHFALGRYGSRVGRVAVVISGGSEPMQRKCHISTDIRPFGRVAVQEADPDLIAALDRATGRIGRLFGRELERARDARLDRASIRFAG